MSALYNLFVLFLFGIVSFENGEGINFNWQNVSIFNVPYCSLKCDNRSHTLCDRFKSDEVPKHCKNFRPLSFLRRELPKFKEELIEAHNGIRNRVAGKMKITNMLELKWDLELERMANSYLRYCLPYWNDNCATTEERFDPFSVYHMIFIKDPESMYRIAQNRYFYKSEDLSSKLVEIALGTWYNEKNYMKAPTLRKFGEIAFHRFYGINNFSHLIYPWANRFGCSLARMFNGFALTCYYYPYYEPEGSVFYFLRGEPTQLCPPKFPIVNPDFSNLCSDVHRGDHSSLHRLNSVLLLILLTVACI